MNWTAPPDGWLVDKLRGEPAFSDGMAIFQGERKGLTLVKHSFNAALKKCSGKKLIPTELIRRDKAGSDKSIPCVVFKGGCWIQEHFYNYALRFKGVKFFLGTRYEENCHALICKVGNKVVGVVMPIRPPI